MGIDLYLEPGTDVNVGFMGLNIREMLVVMKCGDLLFDV